MKILLIVAKDNSRLCNSSLAMAFPSLVATSPLILQQLAALTPRRHSIDMIYERIGEKVRFDENYDLVGMSCTTYNAVQTYNIADSYRELGVPVVLGGYHPSALPEEAKQHADSVVVGEAEVLWPKLLEDLERGSLKPFYKQESFVDPSQIPGARRDLDKKIYQKLPGALQTSRGCPYRCKFCSISNIIEGCQLRPRPVEDIIEEIKNIESEYLFFSDASLTINPPHTKRVFKKLAELDKKFLTYGNISGLVKDEELLRLARDAGCVAWYVGFESVSQATINGIGKSSNKVEEYYNSVKKVHDYGMAIMGSFIFGFDTDTPDIFDMTSEVINSYNIDSADFNILVPFPGTPLFDEFDRDGRIFTKNWSKYTGEQLVFTPKNMSEKEMIDGVNKVTRRYYSFSNFFNRSAQNVRLGFYSSFQFLWRYLAYNKTFKIAEEQS